VFRCDDESIADRSTQPTGLNVNNARSIFASRRDGRTLFVSDATLRYGDVMIVIDAAREQPSDCSKTKRSASSFFDAHESFFLEVLNRCTSASCDVKTRVVRFRPDASATRARREYPNIF
jgi:hypothetical protein